TPKQSMLIGAGRAFAANSARPATTKVGRGRPGPPYEAGRGRPGPPCEGEDDPWPGALTFVVALVTVFATVLVAVICAVTVTAWRPVRSRLSKVWFDLTYHTDCAWCGRRLHHAWLPLRKARIGKIGRWPGVKVPRINSTICPDCQASQPGSSF